MARRYTLKEAFLREEEEGKLRTKGFGKHGQTFPQDKQKLPMSDDDIEGALKDLPKEATDKKVFKKPEEKEKSTFKLGKLEPDLNREVPLEKPSDDPSVSKTNKELSGFKSILEDDKENRGLDKKDPESPFDDAFEKYQEEEEEETKKKLQKLDEPFSNHMEEDCGCPHANIDRSKDGLSANVLSDEEEEFGPTEFVVIKLGDQEDGLNVNTDFGKTVEYGAPGSPNLNEDDMEIKPEEYDEELMENKTNFFGEK